MTCPIAGDLEYQAVVWDSCSLPLGLDPSCQIRMKEKSGIDIEGEGHPNFFLLQTCQSIEGLDEADPAPWPEGLFIRLFLSRSFWSGGGKEPGSGPVPGERGRGGHGGSGFLLSSHGEFWKCRHDRSLSGIFPKDRRDPGILQGRASRGAGGFPWRTPFYPVLFWRTESID